MRANNQSGGDWKKQHLFTFSALTLVHSAAESTSDVWDGAAQWLVVLLELLWKNTSTTVITHYSLKVI